MMPSGDQQVQEMINLSKRPCMNNLLFGDYLLHSKCYSEIEFYPSTFFIGLLAHYNVLFVGDLSSTSRFRNSVA